MIDPILEEERHEDGGLMMACMRSRYEVTQLTITGEWSAAKINEVRSLIRFFSLIVSVSNPDFYILKPMSVWKQGMGLCLDACSKLSEIMRSCLKESSSASHE